VVEPANYDITIYQGATFDLLVQYKDKSGTPVNMSGYTVTAKLFNRQGTAKLADFTSSFVTQASGLFRIKIAASVTSGITEQGQYDVLLTDPNDDKFYILEGAAFWEQGFSGV
jgi:hypothetical protein